MPAHKPAALAVLVAFACATTTPAQQLVRDIVQTGPLPSSMPRQFVATPTFACFTARTADAGAEPWVTDGTAAGTFQLRDLVLGSTDSSPVMACEYQGDLLFTAALDVGRRLFRTNGTVAGTLEVDFGVMPGAVTKLGNGTLLVDSGQVYATDLTPAGTVLLPGMGRFVEDLSVGGVSYGSCLAATTGMAELWRTDGTVAGSRSLGVQQTNFRPSAFAAWSGRIWFQEFGPVGNTWLSSTDGTNAFVRHVSLPQSLSPLLARMYVQNNRLLLCRSDGLFVSDGTVAGTSQLAVPCTDPGNMVPFGGQFFFRAASSSGYELWTTDGTVAGTTQVADLMPGPAGSHPEHFLPTAAGLVFRAVLPAGRRLLRLSATATITDLGAIPNDAPSGVTVTSQVSGFVPFQGGLLFAGTDGAGDEPWRFDGTQPPARLADLARNGPSLLPAGNGVRVAVRDRLFFTADDTQNGLELWSSDGTAAGTQMLDLAPGAASEFDSLTGRSARFGDRVVFASRNRVAITGGTAGNTQNLNATPTSSSFPSLCRSYGTELWFLRLGRLYHSDGTAAGTALAPFQGPGGIVRDFEILANRIVLVTANGIWGTDGVAPAQLLVATYGVTDGLLHRLADDKLVVAAPGGFWATDGTVGGTALLGSFPVPAVSLHSVLRNGKVHHISYHSYFETDGTAGGTAAVATVPIDLEVSALVVTDRDVFLVAATAATGRELWKLDRAQGQFVLVRDFAPGPYSGVVSAEALGSGGLVFVAAGDEITGIEPWVSDGTAAGTLMLSDLHPGRGNSNPRLLGIAEDSVFLAADDGVHGVELWTLPLALTQAASLQSFGFGCGGSVGFPRLSASPAPRPGTANFAMRMSRVRSLTLTALGLANQHTTAVVGPCELLLGGPITTLLTPANVAGEAVFALPLPSSAQLIGAAFVAQGFALDSLAAAGFSASDGVIFVLGR